MFRKARLNLLDSAFARFESSSSAIARPRPEPGFAAGSRGLNANLQAGPNSSGKSGCYSEFGQRLKHNDKRITALQA
eukprot:3022714-Alexandrium_andersonii.AAC.1